MREKITVIQVPTRIKEEGAPVQEEAAMEEVDLGEEKRQRDQG